MKIGNLTEVEQYQAIVRMMNLLGCKAQEPNSIYTWWYRDGGPKDDECIVYIGQIVSLLINEVALEHFLLKVVMIIGKLCSVRLDNYRGEWNVYIDSLEALHKSKELYEALFLSINDYINKK